MSRRRLERKTRKASRKDVSKGRHERTSRKDDTKGRLERTSRKDDTKGRLERASRKGVSKGRLERQLEMMSRRREPGCHLFERLAWLTPVPTGAEINVLDTCCLPSHRCTGSSADGRRRWSFVHRATRSQSEHATSSSAQPPNNEHTPAHP